MDHASEPARSLHEVFTSLAGDPGADPGAALAAAGHAELPGDLLTEAVVQYAEVSPPEVGEHLSPIILGASTDPGLALELLSSAPDVVWDEDVPGETPGPESVPEADDVPDLDFGAGDEPVLPDVPDLGDPADLPDLADRPGLPDGVADDGPAVPEAPAADEEVALTVDDDLPGGDLAAEGWAVDPAVDAWDDGPAGDDLDA